MRRLREGGVPVWPFGVFLALATGVFAGSYLSGAPAPAAAPGAHAGAVPHGAPESGRDSDFAGPAAGVSAPPEFAVGDPAVRGNEAPATAASGADGLGGFPELDLGEDGGAFVPLGPTGAGPEPGLGAAPETLPQGARTSAAVSAPSGGPLAGAPSTVAERSGSAAPPEARREPVGVLPAREAADVPLLVRRRGGNRVVLYETASDAPSVGALAGRWALAGRCRDGVRMTFEQPLRRMGGVRGVGTARGDWSWGVAVPAQACASAPFRPAVPATAGDRERLRAAFPGIPTAAPVTVAREERRLFLAGAGRMAILDGGVVAWSRETDPDATPRLLGVYRRAGRREAYFVETGPAGRWIRLVAVSEHAGGWTAEDAHPSGG